MKKMRRLIAILIIAVMMLSMMPVTAFGASTDTLYGKKFSALIDALGVEGDYDYRELSVHNDSQGKPDWALVFASSGAKDEPSKAMLGDVIVANPESFYPFSMGWGVYNAADGIFYDLVDAWGMGFDGLREAVYALSADDLGYEHMGMLTKIGDANRDGSLSILDATAIQRCLAELSDYPDDDDLRGMKNRRGHDLAYISDYDRDGQRSVLDATKIQRYLAELPNNLPYKVLDAQDYIFDASYMDREFLVKSYDELKAVTSNIKTGVTDYTFVQDNAEKFNEDYFKIHAVAVVYTLLLDYGYSQEVTGVYLDTDGALNLDIHYHTNHTSGEDDILQEMVQPLFTLVEIDNAFLDDIDSIKVNRSTSREPVLPEPIYYEPTADLDLVIWRMAETESPTAMMIQSFNEGQDVFKKLVGIELGEDYYSPEKYNDEFFSENCLIAMYVDKSSESENTRLNAIYLDTDGTLNIHYNDFATASVGVLGARLVLIPLPNDHLDLVKRIKVTEDPYEELPQGGVNYDFTVVSDDQITMPGSDDYLFPAIILNSKQGDALVYEMLGVLGDNTYYGTDTPVRFDMEKYHSGYFTTHVILMFHLTTLPGETIRWEGVYLNPDGILEVHYSKSGPADPNNIVPGDLSYRFVQLSISNRYLENVEHVKLVYDAELD